MTIRQALSQCSIRIFLFMPIGGALKQPHLTTPNQIASASRKVWARLGRCQPGVVELINATIPAQEHTAALAQTKWARRERNELHRGV